MSNPLDDAFAKAEAERALEERMKLEREQAAELAARDLLEGYREVLDGLPRYVDDAPEEITLAWRSGTGPPSSIRPAGSGDDHRGRSVEYGACEGLALRQEGA